MDGICGTTGEHGPAIQRENAHALETERGAVKQIDREDILAARLRIIPQRELGVIAYPGGVRRIVLHRVQEPAAADRIAGLGYTNALIERSGTRNPGEREIAHYPAIGHLVIHDKRVSEVLVRAAGGTVAQRCKE